MEFLGGGNIYLNKFFDESNATNLSYSNPGKKTVYLYLDDSIDSFTFLMNVTGVPYGFLYEDSFYNFDNVDTSLTTAHLDKSGGIMLANSSLKEFSFDDMEDDSIGDNWLYTDDFDVGGLDCTLTGTTTETNGYIQQNNYLSDPFSQCGGSSGLQLGPNWTTGLNLFTSENIAFNVSSVYDSGADNIGCGGNAFVGLGGSTVWTSMYLPDYDPYTFQRENSDADVAFLLTKENKTHWRVQISGTEISDIDIDPDDGGCDVEIRTNNWDAGTWYHYKESCADDSGSLDNDFYVGVDYWIEPAVAVWNQLTFDYYCEQNNVITKTYYMNNSKWNRTNGTVVSNSIFDSTADVTSATFSFVGWSPPPRIC